MKYAVAALTLAFAFAVVPQADAARAKPFNKLTAQEKIERSLQCSARANENKLPLDKRSAFISKCEAGRA